MANDYALEDVIFIWFIQRRSLGKPISADLQENLRINQVDHETIRLILHGLKVSSQDDIRQLEIQGEISTGDVNSAYKFMSQLMNRNTQEMKSMCWWNISPRGLYLENL